MEVLVVSMAEFVRKSRKNKVDISDPEVEKLEKPDEGQSLEFLESKAEDKCSEQVPKSPPELPWELKRLVSAACADALPQEMVKLTSGIVYDLKLYVLGWGCSYFISDRTEAERRLWEAYRAWHGAN